MNTQTELYKLGYEARGNEKDDSFKIYDRKTNKLICTVFYKEYRESENKLHHILVKIMKNGQI